MTSLRAAAHKFVPQSAPLSVTELWSDKDKLCLKFPVSIRDLMRRLQPEIATFRSGNLSASTVKGQARLGITSEGYASFKGHVHENGVVSHDYSFGAVSEFIDSEGKVYAFVNSGSVHGTFGVGSRDDDWQRDVRDCRISANWDSLKRSPVRFRLKVGLNAFDLALDIASAIFPGVAASAIVLIFVVAHSNAVCTGEGDAMNCTTLPSSDST